MDELQEIRKEYRFARLDIDNLQHNPLLQFKYWLNDAMRSGVTEPTAMVLSTASSDGKVSSRMVLLKNIDGEGFVFFTNYGSRKSKQMESNPVASLLFFWPLIERQVCIEGKVTRTSTKESDEYFLIRPEGSRIGAWVSPQSERIPNREYLDNLQQDYTRLFSGKTIERPVNWGGYRLVPNRVEFWQGRENRLHDRFEYVLNGSLWEIYRLAP